MRIICPGFGEVLLYTGVGQSHDCEQDGSVRANGLARFPHFKHRVVDQFLNAIGAESHTLKELCEAREVPNVKLIHGTAITGGNECEECSLCSLGGLEALRKATGRNTARWGSGIRH